MTIAQGEREAAAQRAGARSIARVRLASGRRVLVVSDIHGHIRELKDVLRRADFSANDILIIIGDIVEKGPESLQTLRHVMALCGTHTVYPLIGNVDEHFLSQFLSDDPARQHAMRERAILFKNWWTSSLLHEMCGEMGVTLCESTDMRALLQKARRAFAPEIAFLQSLPAALDTQKMTFVHGGLPGKDLSAFEGADTFPLLKCDNFSEGPLCFQKPVVVGHWPATLYRRRPNNAPYWDEKRGILSIDGGCGIKDDGQLNLLIFPDGEADITDFKRLSADSLPRITALSDQAGNADCHYIRWTDREVELLNKGEKQSLIRHHGAEMRVPTALLIFRDGEIWCNDMTDRLLPVRAGDALSLVYAYDFGCYVKKGDESGWYYGAFDRVTHPERGE